MSYIKDSICHDCALKTRCSDVGYKMFCNNYVKEYYK